MQGGIVPGFADEMPVALPEPRTATHELISYTHEVAYRTSLSELLDARALVARAEINSGDVVRRLLTSVRRSRWMISRPLRTSCSEWNAAAGVNFEIIQQGEVAIKPENQTAIQPEKFMLLVAAERQHLKIENLRQDYETFTMTVAKTDPYVPMVKQTVWVSTEIRKDVNRKMPYWRPSAPPDLQQEWNNRLKKESELQMQAAQQKPCGECTECLRARRNHVSASETCVLIPRCSSAYYGSGFWGDDLDYVPGSGRAIWQPPKTSRVDEDEEFAENLEDRRERQSNRQERYESAATTTVGMSSGTYGDNAEQAESLWEKNLNDGADYIDDGNQTEKTDPDKIVDLIEVLNFRASVVVVHAVNKFVQRGAVRYYCAWRSIVLLGEVLLDGVAQTDAIQPEGLDFRHMVASGLGLDSFGELRCLSFGLNEAFRLKRMPGLLALEAWPREEWPLDGSGFPSPDFHNPFIFPRDFSAVFESAPNGIQTAIDQGSTSFDQPGNGAANEGLAAIVFTLVEKPRKDQSPNASFIPEPQLDAATVALAFRARVWQGSQASNALPANP
jgi:hypothetical protein